MPRLTKRTLDAAKPGPLKDTFLWCSATPGFGARIYPSGRIVFIAQVRIGRAQRRVKIGAYGPFTVDQAREHADRIVRAASEGRDPQREKQERREAITVAELCDLYLEAAEAGQVVTRFGRPKKASTLAIDKGRIERHIKPLIGRFVARDLTTADVQRMADGIAAGKTAAVQKSDKKRGKAVVTGGGSTASRVVELMGGIWTWGGKREHVPARPLVRGVDKVKALPKVRVLAAEELKRLGSTIRAAKATGSAAAVALEIIALSGMRREEVVGLTWAEIDLAGSCIHLGDSKTGRSTRAIGSVVVDRLKSMAKEKASETYLFPNNRGDGAADLKKSITALWIAAELPDARSHALRRTFASLGDELGYSEATIGALLGHSQRSVTARHYIRRPDAALVAAASRISGRIEATMSDRPAAVVSPLSESDQMDKRES